MAKAAQRDETVSETVSDNAEKFGDEGMTRFSDTDLRNISSFEDAIRLAEQAYGSVVDATDEIGSGFIMLDNKDRLCDVPFLILSVSFPEGDYRNPDTGEMSHFAVVRLVTQTGDRFVVTDGGHGIYSQLDEFVVRSGRTGGILVKGGLRKSEYDHPEHGRSVTYYLNV